MTTSSVPAVTDGLLAQLNESQVPAFEVWPGPEAAREMVVLGDVDWDEYEIATIKAGRKWRDERYDLGFEIFVFGEPGTTAADPTPARNRAYEIFASIEDDLATDVTADLGFAVVQWIQVNPRQAHPRQFENAWAYRISGVFAVFARLL